MHLKQKLFIFAAILASLTFAPTGKSQSARGQKPPPATPLGVAAGITAVAPASDTDIEHAVTMFCPPREILHGKDGKISGCSKCPTGTDFYGTGDRSQWELRDGAMWGHFTSASADNLLVSGFGCDSHANNFGGSYVFTRRAGRLRLLKYDPALFVADCHAFAYPNGQDFLVCKTGWYGQGEGTGNVAVTQFDATGDDKSTTLLTVTDTTGTCAEGSSSVVQSSDIKDIKFSTKENGELTGMTVAATLGKDRCSQIGTLQKGKPAPPWLKNYEIEFAFDGKQFHVTPESKKTMALFEKD